MAYNEHNEVEVQILDFWDTIYLVADSKIFAVNVCQDVSNIFKVYI